MTKELKDYQIVICYSRLIMMPVKKVARLGCWSLRAKTCGLGDEKMFGDEKVEHVAACEFTDAFPTFVAIASAS